MCGEIWYCRWVCYGVCARHGAIVGAIVAATVDVTVGAIVSQNSPQPCCWPRVWRYIRGQQYNIRLCGHQKCCSVGKLLHFPSWNVSWLNSWKSNPMYNTHPILYSKILRYMALLKAIMPPTATNVTLAWSVCVSSGVTLGHPAKADRPNEMPFGRDIRVVPSNTVIHMGPRVQTKSLQWCHLSPTYLGTCYYYYYYYYYLELSND